MPNGKDLISFSDERFWLAMASLISYIILAICFGPQAVRDFLIIVASAFSFYFGGK